MICDASTLIAGNKSTDNDVVDVPAQVRTSEQPIRVLFKMQTSSSRLGNDYTLLPSSKKEESNKTRKIKWRFIK